jgi:hypothetical protein
MGSFMHFDSGMDMHFLKIVAATAVAISLAACSSSPSDGDIVKAVESQMQQIDAAFASTGVKFSDVMAVDVKVTNKAKQDDGKWLVQTQTTLTARKDLAELSQAQQTTLVLTFGNFKKGQVIGQPQSGTFHMLKGDSGWMATN